MRAAIRNYNDADEEIIRAKREARAAAIEAAENIVACDLLFNGTAESRHRLRVAIRALAAGPPQSEERHLTPNEHKVMNRALLRSTRPVDPPQSEGGEE
jgi:hypothetical protein